ncbi:MAG: hypothetical protein WCY59_07460 [Anaerovoracaceae bacterium]
MNAWEIKEKLDGRKPGIIEVEQASAVMIPLVKKKMVYTSFLRKGPTGSVRAAKYAFRGGGSIRERSRSVPY